MDGRNESFHVKPAFPKLQNQKIKEKSTFFDKTYLQMSAQKTVTLSLFTIVTATGERDFKALKT